MTFVFIIVGVGGTGSLLARDLPKLLIGTNHQMILVDGDIVEEKNMKRQSFQIQDIGMKKSDALAKKINTFYHTECESYPKFITQDELLVICKSYPTKIPVILGCVDNNNTRMLLEDTFSKLDNVVYIDSANSEFEGNIYCAAKQHDKISGPLRGQIYELDTDIHPTEKSCQAQAAEGNVQFLVTNAKMAIALLEHCHSLMTGTLKVGVTTIGRFEEIHY